MRAYCRRQQHMNYYLQVAAQCSILLFTPLTIEIYIRNELAILQYNTYARIFGFTFFQ